MKPKRVVYVEGGGNEKDLRLRCRGGFAGLIAKCGFKRQPKVVACGGRSEAFRKFRATHKNSSRGDCILMLIDSEDPVTNINKTWEHLRQRDGWWKPEGATDDQVLFMMTSMETWIAADRNALRGRFPRGFNENPLPALPGIESRNRNDVLNALRRATNNRYSKGKISFELLGSLDPNVLEQLPSFSRARRILNEKLGS